jgi:hypothetical protein
MAKAAYVKRKIHRLEREIAGIDKLFYICSRKMAILNNMRRCWNVSAMT